MSRVSFEVEKRVAVGLGKTTFAFSWKRSVQMDLRMVSMFT